MNYFSKAFRKIAKIRRRFRFGHFYSPIVDFADLARRQDAVWPNNPEVLGIDFNDESHQKILLESFPKYIEKYDYPEVLAESSDLRKFFTQNSQFSWLDSRLLFVLLQKIRPSQVIEVGSGFSSLLMADVNLRFLQQKCDITCIEPYPRRFMTKGIAGISRLITKKVQDVPVSIFEQLSNGDILFIDSSHVSKTGSDVNYLFFEVFPRLKKGVIIHVHDIFLPNDYLKDWVLDEERSWNEQYLLRALLMYSSGFKVVFGAAYAFHKWPELVRQALNLPSKKAFGGGSFWIERT